MVRVILLLLLVIVTVVGQSQPTSPPLPPDTLKFLSDIPNHQLTFYDGNRPFNNNGYYASSTFNDKYDWPSYFEASLSPTYNYKKHRVKSIYLYDATNSLQAAFFFDTAGHSCGGIVPGEYIIWYKDYPLSKTVYARVKRFYGPNWKLLRRDSTLEKTIHYLAGDTTMCYRFVRRWVHATGSHLNERNAIDNTKYYNVPMEPTTPFSFDAQNKTVIYLNKKLITNAQPDSLYLDSYQSYNQYFAAELPNKKTITDHVANTHRFRKKFNVFKGESYYYSGASFHEPLSLHYPMNCSTSSNTSAPISKNSYRCRLNAKGLIETVYYFNYPWLYRAEDSTDHSPPSTFPKQAQNPLIQFKYTLRYTYYE